MRRESRDINKGFCYVLRQVWIFLLLLFTEKRVGMRDYYLAESARQKKKITAKKQPGFPIDYGKSSSSLFMINLTLFLLEKK